MGTESIPYPITIVTAGPKPSQPSVSAGGSCIVASTFTLSFSSTDPDGHQVRYGVDWDNDGSVDQWVPPTGYVNSGSVQSASRTYSTTGAKSVAVLTENNQGVRSARTSYSFSCGNCPVGYVLQGGQCVISACPSGYVKQGNQCVLANQCTTPPKCVGDDLVNSCNGDTVAVCDWGCSAGACYVYPDSARIRRPPLPNGAIRILPNG